MDSPYKTYHGIYCSDCCDFECKLYVEQAGLEIYHLEQQTVMHDCAETRLIMEKIKPRNGQNENYTVDKWIGK